MSVRALFLCGAIANSTIGLAVSGLQFNRFRTFDGDKRKIAAETAPERNAVTKYLDYIGQIMCPHAIHQQSEDMRYRCSRFAILDAT
jgi:hypothetical protein